MNKSLKVVSSVALAGMLAINVLNPMALAKSVDDRYDTRLAGTYKGMAQFVLANKNDYVTYREIANSDKFTNVESFKGAGVPSNDNELVQTGDKFVADGKEYTVVVYGEVDKNSDRLTQDDALKILKHFTGSSKMTNAAELEAANVDRTNDRITQDDALQVLKYFTGSSSTLIKGNLPHDESMVEDIQYTLVANERKVINNTDVTAYTDGTSTAVDTLKDISIVVTPGTGITGQTLKARYLIDGEIVGSETNINSSFSTNNVTATITVTGNTVKAWKNGTIVAEIFYEDEAGIEHIVGRTNIEKQIIESGNIKTTNVSTERSTSRTGKLTIAAKDIKKAYYKVGVANVNTDFIDANGDLVDSVKEATVSNNKVTKADVTGLTENAVNTVSYMIIDSYGNVKIESTIIALENAKQMQTPTIANLDLDSANKFTWTAPTKAVDNSDLSLGSEKLTYTVNLIKNNEIVDTKTIVTDTDDLEYVVPSTVGRYKISVKVNTTSDGKYTESEIVNSNEVEVSKLNSLQNVKIEKTKTTVDNDTLKISWTDSNDADYENGYTFKLYTIDAEGEVDSGTLISNSDITINDENTEATVLFADLSVSNNVVYYVGIEVNPASSQYKKVKSDEAESNKLINPTASGCNVANADLTTTDAKLTIGSPIVKINNKEVKYLVEFYDLGTKIDETTGQPALTYTANSMSKTYSLTPVKNENGVATGDYTIDINGLEEGKTYTIKVFAMIDDEKVTLANTAQSGYINNVDGYIQLKTTGVLPTFNGTISNVTADDFEVASKDSSKIVISATNIGLKGVAYDTTSMNLTSADATIFTRNLAIAKVLHNDDILNINGNNVTITLNSREAMGSLASIDLSDVLLTINENNQISRTITLPTNSSKKAKKLTLNGTGSIFTVTQGGAEEIVLNNGVEVKVNANSYIVVAGAEATVNGVKVKSNADTAVSVDGSGNVTVNKLAQTTFDATFTVDTAAKYALTNFELKTIDTEDRYTISTKVGKIFKKSTNAQSKVVYTNEADLTEEYLDEDLDAGTVITTIKVASDRTVRSRLAQIAGDDVKAYDLIKFLGNFDAYKDIKVNITTTKGSKIVKLSFVGDQTINPTPAVKDGMAITIDPNVTETK